MSVSSAFMLKTQLDISFALLKEIRAFRSEVADMLIVSRPYFIRIRFDFIQKLYKFKKIVVAVQAFVASIAAARRATGRVTKKKKRKNGRCNNSSRTGISIRGSR